jgi:hypothetical protein
VTQPALFAAPPRTRRPRPTPPTQPAPEPRTGPRPGEPLNQADAELGWQHPYVTPRRAYEIRRETEARTHPTEERKPA